MQTLAFDGRMGASGDMLLGALLAAGADPDVLEPVEDALPVRYRIDQTIKNGIRATTVDILLTDENSDETEVNEHTHEHAHDEHTHDEHTHDEHTHDEHTHDEHTHEHTHDEHTHEHTHDEHTHAEGHGPHRTYSEVVELVEGMALPEEIETDALAVFELLGESEASVHGTDLEETHFHEVGADDAVADIVGATLLFADLDPDRVVTTPLATGGGEVDASHGTYPVPVPAVVELAERADWCLQGGPVETELLTPTGAALLAHYAVGVETLPPLDLEASGYGAGTRDFPDRPNVLRALLGETHGTLVREPITVLETNLDDATPEVLGDLQASLTEVGARDVATLPATMKKSRPGHLVKVVVSPEDAERVAHRLAAETGTLGVRETGSGHRFVAHREFETVTLEVDGDSFEVTVKIATDDEGELLDVSAEYDDAAEIARETGVPTREIMRRAETERYETSTEPTETT